MWESLSKNHQTAGLMEIWGMRRKIAEFLLLSLSFLFMILAGCGGDGGDNTSPQPATASPEIVSGVASAGAPLAGVVTIKDASSQPNRSKP